MGRVQGFAGALLMASTLIACGSDKDPTTPQPPEDPLIAIEVEAPSTSLMRGTTTRLTASGRRASGATASVSVSWDSSDPQVATVSTNGTVTAVSAGSVTLTATAAGVTGSVSLTVTNQALTYLIYMAADNNLTFAGLGDIEELEAVGSSDSINIVVQAEFSPSELARVGLTAGDINLPNLNTIRYHVRRGTTAPGPDGPIVDIGPQDMTDPATLADFITWAATTYPAERYALVLWNHGGGYHGLIEDHTHGGSSLMTLAELRSGLTTAGIHFDVIDFDMCLMGGVETAVSVEGLADYLVFSEELIPGAGNPYDRILARLRADPEMSAEALATTTVDEYMTEYSGGRASVTRSVFDMAALDQVVSAWNGLADELTGNLVAYSSQLSSVIPQTQAYEYAYLRDFGDFAGRLRGAGPGPVLDSRLADVQTALSAAVTRSSFYTATTYEAESMDGSTGATLLLPSGAASDRLPDSGPGSLASYQAEYSSLRWSAFLAQWLAGSGTVDVFDQGAAPLQVALAWDTASVSQAVDVDLWVLEPNGNLYIPYLGVLTPNGTFSADSYESGEWFELYFTRRYVEVGTYYFFADLWSDPSDFGAVYNVFSRALGDAHWSALYAEPLPQLTTATSWRDDPNATLNDAIGGAYTDLQYVATWAPGSPALATSIPSYEAPGFTPPRLTPEQWSTIRRLPQGRGGAAQPLPHQAEQASVPSPSFRIPARR